MINLENIYCDIEYSEVMSNLQGITILQVNTKWGKPILVKFAFEMNVGYEIAHNI